MTTKLFLPFFILFTPVLYGQNIEGKWLSEDLTNQVFHIQGNGKMDLIDLENPDEKVLKNITLKYLTYENDGQNLIEIQYFEGETKSGSRKYAYRIMGDTLFLRRVNHSLNNNIAKSVTIEKEEKFIRVE
jgi:hypothetical protein